MQLPISVTFSGAVSINYKEPTERHRQPAVIIRKLIRAERGLTYIADASARRPLTCAASLQTVFSQENKTYTQQRLGLLRPISSEDAAKLCLLIMSTNENMRGGDGGDTRRTWKSNENTERGVKDWKNRSHTEDTSESWHEKFTGTPRSILCSPDKHDCCSRSTGPRSHKSLPDFKD